MMMLALATVEPLSTSLAPYFEQACRQGLERGHALQVTRLALGLFTLLAPLHQLGDDAYQQLQCAALLHDIGWLDGADRHHKHSFKHIRTAPLPFTEREKLMVALIARYHRRALPADDHDGYRDLFRAERRQVRVLAGILRVADGLDRTHSDTIADLGCVIDTDMLTLACATRHNAEEERASALAKGALLEQVCKRTLNITWQIAAPTGLNTSSPS